MEGKKIIISHGWSDFSLNYQSKYLSVEWSKKNKVLFLDNKKKHQGIVHVSQNLQVMEWPGNRPVGWKDFVFAFKTLKQFKPDIVISNFASNDILMWVSWILKVENRICYYHTMVQQHLEDYGHLSYRQRFNVFRKGLAFRKATHLLASSHAAKNDLVKYYRTNPEKVFVFPNIIEDSQERNPGEPNRIGFLGRLDKSKGVDILINAFYKLNTYFPHVQLLIAGKGVEEANLKKMADELGIRDQIVFAGSISGNEVRHFLASLHFLVVPSRMDNLPTVALEALSTATPVIGSNRGGIPDIIHDGYNGLLFENEHSDSLFEKMQMVLKHEIEWRDLSRNARISYEERFSPKTLLPRFQRLFNKDSNVNFSK
ncbi:MAG: glycosyltransferase family 4 protein [Bacteroidetes bacterium]|nr:glycosyltransferase family 4 protein [Bacteroidota bacterium]